MKKRNILIIAILMMAVGFAAVSTTLYINGLTTISKNEIFVADVIFTSADTYDESTASINETGKIITFNSKVLKNLGEKTTLDYTISNYNRQYDANVVVSIRMKEENNPLSEYIKITNSLNGEFTLNAQSEKSGVLEIELMKLYTGEEDIKIEFTIEYQASGLERNTLADEILIKECEINSEWLYDYTGSEQEFKVPCSGNYRLETWGAQGGASNVTYIGGYGGYATGEAKLSKNKIVYINVGGAGYSNGSSHSPVGAAGGYNGGGTSTPNTGVNHLYGSGGGATHIALVSGILSTLSENIDKILIVSGGGGGGRWQPNVSTGVTGYGGIGGGFHGGYGTINSNGTAIGGGTQSGVLPGIGLWESGSFGQGGNANADGAGGGGFYGGNSGSAGGGGSGYIANILLKNKLMYCYNCEESNEESTKTISTINVSEEPISSYAKIGNGYAKITYLGK